MTKILEEYCKSINQQYKTGKAKEHSYRPAIIKLFENFKEIKIVSNEAARIDCGAPDITIYDRDNFEIGYIETKDIHIKLEKEMNSEQLTRYRNAIDNLILTDYLNFYFFHDGKLVKKVILAQLKNGKISLKKESIENFVAYCNEFSSRTVKALSSSSELAIRMANSGKIIKDAILKAFKDQRYNSSFEEQLAAFRDVLIKNLSKEKFADLYAQTVVYGLFVARCFSEDRFLTRANVSHLLPKTNPFLRKIFNHLAGPELDDRLSWIVENVITLFNRCDFETIYRELTLGVKGDDPVVDFYETFLLHFDPAQKKRLGVYYTPVPAVGYIVRSVDLLLKNEFKIKDGIASAEKVTKDEVESDKVILLDPATGTGTFLLESIKFIKEKFKGNEGLWQSYISNNFLKRVFGFEILMAPYTVAHLKIGMELRKLGYDFQDNERLNIYLTNTLEETRDITNLFPFARWLTEESVNASKVKKKYPIMVVMGNPPYSGESCNNGDWIKQLLKGKDTDSGKETESYFHLQGEPLKERNTKWLNDDYVKFIRFSQWRIDNTGYGVMAFVTNHGFIDNPTFRGMRESLLTDFDKIYILDLHGNTKKKEKTPDGKIDKNIFDIQQGVSINFFVKNNSKEDGAFADVYHADLWDDKRELFDDDGNLIGGKYYWLLNNDLASTNWTKLNPKYPFLYLNHQEVTFDEEYDEYIKVTDIFPTHSVGMVTARDKLTIHFSKKEVWDTVNEFVSMEVEDAREFFNLKKDVRDWKIHLAQEDLIGTGPDKKNIQKVCYRPLDTRYTYYTGKSKGFLCMPRPEVMNNIVRSGNMVLLTSRMTKGEKFNHHLVTDCITEAICLSPKTSNNAFAFPLYKYEENKKLINITKEFVEKISLVTGLFFGKGRNSFDENDIFNYITAILHSNEYKTRYGYRLERDFARVPLPPDKKIFQELSKLGDEISKTYIFKRPISVKGKFPVSGSSIVEKNEYNAKNNRLYINETQYFSGVKNNVWGHYIGGYQVLERWLKYRKGLKLSFNDISDFLKNISIIEGVIDAINKVDIAIKKQGGFPFQVKSNLKAVVNFNVKIDQSVEDKKIPKVVEKRIALASYILENLDDKDLTRTKFAKVFYLSDIVNNLKLKTKYKREVAGPLDSNAWYNENVGIETLAERRGIFSAQKVKNSFKYTHGDNISTYSKKIDGYFSKDEVDGINYILDLTKKMSTKKSELYATLYACWNDLIITNRRQPTPNQLIKKFYSWHPKKDKFKKDDLEKAIVFMKKIGLIPLGNSGHTV